MSQIEKNKDLVLQITKAKNENDVEKLREFLAPNFKAHISNLPEPLNREQYIQGVIESHKAFSNLIIEVEEIIAEGDRTASRISASGKHTGMFHGFMATQKEVKFCGMIMRRFENGKVVEEWQVNDHLTLFHQMGLSINHII